jgi:hypothetical protein
MKILGCDLHAKATVHCDGRSARRRTPGSEIREKASSTLSRLTGIGWALLRSLEAALVLEALRRALSQRRPRPGLVHHSDRGVQYASLDYTARLEQHGIRITMSRRGKWAMVAYTGEVVGSQPRCSRGLPGPPRRGRMRQVLGGARENRTGFDNLYPSLACGRAPLPGNASSPFARHSPFQTSSRLGLS